MNYLFPNTNLEKSKFHQNGCSEQVWKHFLNFVAFCHDAATYREGILEARKCARGQKGKILRDWQQEEAKLESREGRARFRAAECVWDIEEALVTDSDRLLLQRILEQTGLDKSLRSHEAANFWFFAVSEFSAP
ncbi:hypothetical protein [Acidimangrovimonas pyrenivorans]|uniref:Uncharacterized protein n=1 Tax=Acidimangrovimonas pyrenivorans TaxID=2030798 RepID=A0ABV7AIU7_9RHOB